MTDTTAPSFTVKRWITASFLGWFAGAFAVILTSSLFDAAGLEGFQFYLGISIGGAIGYMQWRLLRHSGVGLDWIWGACAGMGFPFLVNDLLSRFAVYSLGFWYLPVNIVAGALVVSVWHQRILRTKFGAAVSWFPVSFVAWTVAPMLLPASDSLRFLGAPNIITLIMNISSIIGSGALLGLITGAKMRSILTPQG